jgi:hypothetical protein
MPHAALKLVGGANTAETPAQNENGGIAQTNLIRYVYDPSGLTLVAKLGGWSPFFSSGTYSAVAAMWAWEDLNSVAHLGIGTQGPFAQLSIITHGAATAITPTLLATTGTPQIASTLDSDVILITDPDLIGSAASVYVTTQISIGGIVIFGSYPIAYFSPPHQYGILATDILGNPAIATASSSAPVLPIFGTAVGSTVVEVTFPAYTYAVGDTFAVITPTTVGGLLLYGNYTVFQILDSSHFYIQASSPATSSAGAALNGGAAVYFYDNNFLGTTQPATDWTLENFGQDLVACYVSPTAESGYQPIYLWQPGQPNALAIPQAPIVNDGIFVAMPQRQIIAWGSTETGIQDRLLISWCDVNNPYQWIPLVTNQAGNYRIPKGSKIVGCIQGPTQGLIWTDIDVWSMQYIGPPDVYGFNEIGTGCGLIARHAAASANGIVWWMGPSQFFTLSSNGVQPLPCPVWDVVFQNLNQAQLSNIRVGVNSLFNEIWWFFTAASTQASQNDSFVKYNYLLNLWDYGIGTLGRSAWIDQSVLGPPIGADPTSLLLYQHETSNDAAGTAMDSYFLTGYYATNEGDLKSFVDWVWPDMKWGQYSEAQTASVSITFYCVDYPGQTPLEYGPYTVTQATEYFYTRFRARLMALKIGSTDLGSYWRIGMLRYRYALDGKI